MDAVISIERALATPDLRWPFPPELQWLAERAAEHRVIVEIGSYQGRSTVAMAANTPGVVYAMDDWYGPRDDFGMKDDDRIGLFARFLRNVDGLPVRALRCDHANAGTALPLDVVPDMVFIDGDHGYEGARRDIETWKQRIAPGGLLCGHDRDHWGVRKALDHCLLGWTIVGPNTTLWKWTKGV